jgi:hypothetical protein
VTTSVGIPGSGLYYVDTKNVKKKDTLKSKTKPRSDYTSDGLGNSVIHQEAISLGDKKFSHKSQDAQELYDDLQGTKDALSSSEISESGIEKMTDSTSEIIGECQEESFLSVDQLFKNCDLPVNWMEVISNREPVSSGYDEVAWAFLHKMAAKVLAENTDAYLDIINRVNPYDDLLDYAKDFVVGVNASGRLEIEVTLLNNTPKETPKEFTEMYHALSIRTARDTFALLPVEDVTVNILRKGEALLIKNYKREAFQYLNFDKLSPTQIVELC